MDKFSVIIVIGALLLAVGVGVLSAEPVSETHETSCTPDQSLTMGLVDGNVTATVTDVFCDSENGAYNVTHVYQGFVTDGEIVFHQIV